MKTCLCLIFLSLSFAAHAIDAWPKPDGSSCEFYKQLEEELHCEKEGVDYLSHYAPYYCEKFKEKEKVWKGELKNWASDTRICLQKALYAYRSDPHLTCKSLEVLAFHTHSACYDQSKLCKLSLEDLTKVMKVIKLKDMFKEVKIGSLIESCFNDWFN